MPSSPCAPRLAVHLTWIAALGCAQAFSQPQGSADSALELGAAPGRGDAIWIHFPTGAFELEGSAEAAELAIAAWSFGPQGSTQQRFAELGGSFELRLEGARCWLEARVASGRLEEGFEALVEALCLPAAALDFEAAAIDRATRRARRAPEQQLCAAALEFLWPAPASQAGPAELEAAAQALFAAPTLGVSSGLPSERWRPWASRARQALAQRYPGPPKPAPARPCPSVPERLWLPRQEPGPEQLLLGFAAPAELGRGSGGFDLAPALDDRAPSQRLLALLPPGAAPRLAPLETPSGPLLAVHLAHAQARPEALLAALLEWLRSPETLAAAMPIPGAGQRTSAELALLAEAEGQSADPGAEREAIVACLRAEPRFLALLAPAAGAAESEAGAGVRRLDGTPWQRGSAAGRRQARALAEALGPWAALEQLELELEFAPAGRPPLALLQRRTLSELGLEVFSGPAGGPAQTPMLRLSPAGSERFEGGRRLPLEGSGLADAVESERRAWSRLLADLGAEGPLALEPAGPAAWVLVADSGPLAQLELDAQGLPQSLRSLPSGRSTQFEAWGWSESVGGLRLRLPAGYRTDAGRFEVRTAGGRACAAPRRGPAVDSEPPPPPRWGDDPSQDG